MFCSITQPAVYLRDSLRPQKRCALCTVWGLCVVKRLWRWEDSWTNEGRDKHLDRTHQVDDEQCPDGTVTNHGATVWCISQHSNSEKRSRVSRISSQTPKHPVWSLGFRPPNQHLRYDYTSSPHKQAYAQPSAIISIWWNNREDQGNTVTSTTSCRVDGFKQASSVIIYSIPLYKDCKIKMSTPTKMEMKGLFFCCRTNTGAALFMVLFKLRLHSFYYGCYHFLFFCSTISSLIWFGFHSDFHSNFHWLQTFSLSLVVIIIMIHVKFNNFKTAQ